MERENPEENKREPDYSDVKSISTTFTIINHLKENPHSSTTEIAETTGISKSSVFKHLATLCRNGYVIKDGLTYRLSLRFLETGAMIREQLEGQYALKETAKELSELTNEVAFFKVIEDHQAVVLYREKSSRGVFTKARVGRRFPLHQTAGGKAMLAEFSNPTVRAIFDRYDSPSATTNTIVTIDELIEELETIRERGYAYNFEESTNGVWGVGVPILKPEGEIFGAISIAGPQKRMEGRIEEEIPERLLEVKNDMELNIRYGPE